MRGLTAKAAHFDGAGEIIAQVGPILGNGDLDLLAHGIAAEVIHAIRTAGVGFKVCSVFTLIVQGEMEVIVAGQLFLGADQIVELELHLVPGLELGGLGEDLAVRIQEVIADAPGGDHLVGLNAVLLHADDMTAGGEAGDRHGAVSRHGDAAVGKAVKAHLVGDGGAGHGDGAAFLRLKAVGCPCIAQVEQDVVLGIQCFLCIAAYGGIHAVHGHVGLDGRAVRTHGDHKHAGKLRPDGGQLRAAHALGMGHGIIGHQHQGGAVFIGLHRGQGAVVFIGGDGHHIAGLTVKVHHGVVYIRQSDFGILGVLNGLPAAEHIQLPGLALLQVQIALLIDIQVYITQVVNILIEAVHGVLGEGGIADVQVLLGHGDALAVRKPGKGPVGHAVGMLHTHKVIRSIPTATNRGRAEGGHYIVIHRFHGQRIFKLIDPVAAELAQADGGAGGSRDGNVERLREAAVNGQGAFIRYRICRPLRNREGIKLAGLVTHGGKGSLDGIARDKNAGGVGGAPVSGDAWLGLAVHAVGADHLIVDGVVGVLDPAVVGGIDFIDTLEGDGSGVLRHGDNDAAVVLAGFIIALGPVVADRQLHIGILQFVAISHGGLAGQQVHIALDAAGVAIQLQGRQLGAVQARQIHGGHGDLLDLGGGVEQGINLRILVVHSGEIAGKAIGHGEGGLALFIGNSAVNDGDIAGLGIHPAQLGPLQGLGRSFQLGRSLVAVAFHGVEACGGSGDLLTHIHLGGSIHPGVVIGISILVTHDIKVHHVAIEQRGIGDHGAVVANTIVGRGAVIGIAAVDIEAAGVGLNAENLGDPAGAAHIQILPGCFLGKCITEGQLMGLDQGVQGGNALQCIGKAVFLGFKGGDLHLLRRMEIAARCLGAERHLHGGGSRLLHSDGVLLRLFSLVHAGPGGIAALHGDDGAVRHGDLRRALILRAVHAGADLEVLVAGGGRHHHAADIGGQLQRVAVGVLIEGRGQLAGTEGQVLDGGVIVVPAAAQVVAIGTGVHNADLIAGFQLAGSHGKGGEAFFGKPVVEGAHPAGLTAAAEFAQAVDLADVGSAAGMGVSLGVQRLGDTAHHGGFLGELHPGIHQRAVPGGAIVFGIGGVFHDDMGLAQVNGRCQHGGGHQGQGHHQCQQQG